MCTLGAAPDRVDVGVSLRLAANDGFLFVDSATQMSRSGRYEPFNGAIRVAAVIESKPL
jgi:hypothetical protein